MVEKIMRTRMLHRFFNPSCKTYVGTSSVTDIIIRDHGVYHDSRVFFMISEPLFQPKVAKMVAKASGFFNFFNSRVMDSVFFQLTCDYEWFLS